MINLLKAKNNHLRSSAYLNYFKYLHYLCPGGLEQTGYIVTRLEHLSIGPPKEGKYLLCGLV